MEKAADTFGGIDQIILNHAVAPVGFLHLSKDPAGMAETVMKTNYGGYVHLAMAAMPYLKKSGVVNRKSRIICISSGSAHEPMPTIAAYTASKHANHGFFAALRRELAMLKVNNLTVTIITLGFIATETALANT